MTLQYRQGDVFIERVSDADVPADAVLVARDQDRVVLAYGEVTGHAHAIADRNADLFSKPGSENRWLVIRPTAKAIEGPAAFLRHEEHATITLEPGTYRVTHQREYAPGEIRRVAD